MKKHSLTLITVYIISMACNTPIFAQLEDLMVCGHIDEDSTMLSKVSIVNEIKSINPNPTGKDFKVSVLYFKAANDNFMASDTTIYSAETQCRVANWPADSTKPNWFGELLISTAYNAQTVDTDTASKPYSITTYFYRMSNGNLWVYGDEVAYTGTTINKGTSEAEWRTINEDVHQWYIDNYDLRSLDNDSDGEVDMIVFVNRARYNMGFQGIAINYLPSGIISDASDSTEPIIRGSSSLSTNSGVYQRGVYDLGWRHIIFHEMAHQLHNEYSHYNKLHRWNLLSGSYPDPHTSVSGLVQSAWEKSDLNWLTFTEITDNRIDLKLGNVTTTNQAVKIPVNTNDYFVLEVRKNNAFFEISPDSGCGATTGLGEGLLISYSQNNTEPAIRPADGAVTWIDPPTNTIKDGDSTDLFPNGGITAITPYTTPNTNDHNGINTHIAITNIHQDGDSIVFNIFQNYWSGPITSNTTWSSANSPYYIGGDITVESGATLSITANTEVIFLSGDAESGGNNTSKSEIIVEGELKADDATFKHVDGTKGGWQGIFFENGCDADSWIDGCTIEDAYYGVQTYEDCRKSPKRKKKSFRRRPESILTC